MGTKIKKCLIVSGAPEDSAEYIKEYIDGRFVICADSGYLKCLSLGIEPDLIIGDFDSSDSPNKKYPHLQLEVRKDDTDTFSCVKKAQKLGFNDIIIVGALGGRFDHTYANLMSIVYCCNNNIECSVINSKNHISIKSGNFSIYKGKYKYFSLFPLFDSCIVSISGAEYNLTDKKLESYEQLTVSNEFKNDEVKISVPKGKIILIFCND